MTPNTDTFYAMIDILALFYSVYLKLQMVLQLGNVSTIRYLDISAATLSEDLRRVLPGFHEFKGCYSTSVFAGKGKFKWLKILGSDEGFLDAFSLLGEQQGFYETVGKFLKNLPAEFMVRTLPFQSTKQDRRCSKRRKQYQTHTCFHHHKMLWRCISLGKFPENGMEECTITTFSSLRPKHSRMENNGWEHRNSLDGS